MSAGQTAAGPSRGEPFADAGPTRGRLPAVDGLRAFAALWVLLFHMHAFSEVQLWRGVDQLAAAGSAGVSLFLLLSGFCLYVPFAGGRLERFRVLPFLRRRCRRLLPAYYASLALVLMAHLVADGRLGLAQHTARQYVEQVLSHGLLVHQLAPSTFYGLNGAYWSLGLEWELYLLMPLVVLGVRRLGLRRTLLGVAAVSVTYALAVASVEAAGLLDPQGPWATAVLPNFVLGRWFEFALGVLAAELYVAGGLGAGRLRALWLLALPAAAGALVLQDNPLNHVLHGVVFLAVLCTVLADDNLVARGFSCRPVAGLGVMSYSLYLVHQPIVESVASVLLEQAVPPSAVFLRLVLLLPVVLAVAALLFVTVERWSMRTPASVRRDDVHAPPHGKDSPDPLPPRATTAEPRASRAAR